MMQTIITLYRWTRSELKYLSKNGKEITEIPRVATSETGTAQTAQVPRHTSLPERGCKTEPGKRVRFQQDEYSQRKSPGKACQRG